MLTPNPAPQQTNDEWPIFMDVSYFIKQTKSDSF